MEAAAQYPHLMDGVTTGSALYTDCSPFYIVPILYYYGWTMLGYKNIIASVINYSTVCGGCWNSYYSNMIIVFLQSKNVFWSNRNKSIALYFWFFPKARASFWWASLAWSYCWNTSFISPLSWSCIITVIVIMYLYCVSSLCHDLFPRWTILLLLMWCKQVVIITT